MKRKIYKYKSYAHFDSKKVAYPWISYIESPEKIVHHGFYPFIHFELKTWKFDNEKKDTKTKPRDINYSSHIDRYIYEYYNELLNVKYNEYAEKHGINKCAVAYRTNLHQNNITIAKEVFAFISHSPDSFIMISDFTKYFDKIDHGYLKTCLEEVLGVNRLSNDWYKIYRSISKYSYIDIHDLIDQFGITMKELRERNQICSIKELVQSEKLPDSSPRMDTISRPPFPQLEGRR